MKKRNYLGGFKLSGVSPKMECSKNLTDLTTVGAKLDHCDVVQLIQVLNAAMDCSSDWNYINLTMFRDTDYLTLTYMDNK